MKQSQRQDDQCKCAYPQEWQWEDQDSRQIEEEVDLQTSRWTGEVVERTVLVELVERERHPNFTDEHKPERQEEQEGQWEQAKVEEQWEHVQG